MRLIKNILTSLILLALVAPSSLFAQELNCDVQIQAPQVSNINPSTFEVKEEYYPKIS